MILNRAFAAVAVAVGLAGGVSLVPVGAAYAESTAPGGSGKAALGLAAPALPKVDWRRGDPVNKWEEGKVYVLDFWATWCKPCIAVMPHMIDLQEKYRDKGVTMLGLAIWPQERAKPTKDFVDSYKTPEGKTLNYAIADDIDNKVAQRFMEAMNKNGIPTVMIIDQKGRLAWAGHPLSGMDEALEQIVAGTYDLEKQVAEAKARDERDAKARGLMMEYQTAQMSGDWNKLIEISDKLIALDPEQFGQAGLVKYMLLITKLNDKTRAASVGRELLAGPLSKNAAALNGLAYVIVDHEEIKDEDRDLDLALAAANRANELEEGKRPEVLDTLARVYFEQKKFDEAIRMQEKAIVLAADNEMMVKDFQESLAEYKKAAAGE